MKKNVKKYLLVTPLILLLVILWFLNYAVQYLKDTTYDFVYETNKQSVIAFSQELSGLSEAGITSADYGHIYTTLIHKFNVELGSKDVIVTFLKDESGTIHHSTAYNENYLSDILSIETNLVAIDKAFETRGNGDITFVREGTDKKAYFHRFYSGENDFTLFMTVERRAVEAQVDILGITVPICFIGLLLLVMSEYTIWIHVYHVHEAHNESD